MRNNEGANPKDIAAMGGRALDVVERLHSRDNLIEFLSSRVPSLSLESRNMTEIGRRIHNI